MGYLNRYSVDPQSSWKSIFDKLVSYIPKIHGWFGISSRTLTPSYNAKSVSSALFIAIAKSLSVWVASIIDLRESMFIVRANPLGDRWVEHIRNTYVDYGLNPDEYTWTNTNNEYSTDEYYNILVQNAQRLIELFKKQDVSLNAFVEAITRLLPPGSSVEVVEPYKLIKPWPSANLYKSRQLPSETEAEYEARLISYNQLYKSRRKLSKGNSLAFPNTHYPVPASSKILNEEDNLKNERLDLLKMDLGSYTNLGRTGTKRFISSRNYGGRVEIILSNLPNQDVIDVLKTVKAAGIEIVVYATQFLGEAVFDVNSDLGSRNNPKVFTFDYQLYSEVGVASTSRSAIALPVYTS